MAWRQFAGLSAILLLGAIPAWTQCFPGMGTGRFRLAGRVVDRESKIEVATALIRLEGRSERRQGVTDNRGRFEFLCLGADSYVLEINRDGYQSARVQINILSATLPDEVMYMEPAATHTPKPESHSLSARTARASKVLIHEY